MSLYNEFRRTLEVDVADNWNCLVECVRLDSLSVSLATCLYTRTVLAAVKYVSTISSPSSPRHATEHADKITSLVFKSIKCTIHILIDLSQIFIRIYIE